MEFDRLGAETGRKPSRCMLEYLRPKIDTAWCNMTEPRDARSTPMIGQERADAGHCELDDRPKRNTLPKLHLSRGVIGFRVGIFL